MTDRRVAGNVSSILVTLGTFALAVLSPLRESAAQTAGAAGETGAPSKPGPVAPEQGTSPPAEAAPCTTDQIDALVGALHDWAKGFLESRRVLSESRGCQRPNVLCLDRFGAPADDEVPKRTAAGEPFSVYVLVPAIDRGRLMIATSLRAGTVQATGSYEGGPPSGSRADSAKSDPACQPTAAQTDEIKAAALPIAELAAHPGLEGLAIPQGSWQTAYWASTFAGQIFQDWTRWAERSKSGSLSQYLSVGTKLELPAGDAIRIDFIRNEPGARTPSSERHYDVAVDNGRYYLELAVLVPFVYRGSHTVTLTPDVGTSELRTNVEEDWHVTGAAMIDYFPFGRQKGQLTSFRNCRSSACYENWLGIQLGTGVDNLFRDWYLGIVFEPVSGLNFNIGASLLEGEFLPAGRAEGMLLPSPSDLQFSTQYMVRPYFGLSLTLDILQTLDRAATGVRQYM